jgi:hypothetical protein
MRRSPLATAALAIAAAAALALGGLWWTSNAPPPPTAVAGWPLPTRAAAVPDAVPDAVAARPTSFPNPAEILQFDLDQVRRLLPDRDEVVRGDAGVLTDGGTVDYSGTVPGGTQYLLEVACLGVGELEIDVVTPDGSQHRRALGCDGTLSAVEFAAGSTGQALVLLVARTSRFVGIAVQLVLR